jgi:hypothetical protein
MRKGACCHTKRSRRIEAAPHGHLVRGSPAPQLDRTPGDRVVSRYKAMSEVTSSDAEPATQRETEMAKTAKRSNEVA